ncbi:acyl transferase [Flagellimonas allohymeniacidonis]|uniref:Acyl transferase n=1 Tax=Flagellimonas allohymeniacidonis TaxID=2517819 RepID=A0A4Q8QC33_9FLAO|nr:acyl transferase [Allomuricauda hymeniacidonis]TAI47952.1 acyl transferase [Allomuricauda hymeniacidonis]
MDVKRIQKIFALDNQADFNDLALEIFDFQYRNNSIYRKYCKLLGKSPSNVSQTLDIPFLPIEFFKSERIICSGKVPELVFESSGTTGSLTSKHFVLDARLYQQSYRLAFEKFYGPINEYCVLALLPSYLERQNSSLVYMVNDLIEKSGHSDSGFYLNNLQELSSTLLRLEKAKQKTLLIGVSFALLDLAEEFPIPLRHTTIMETGGMKGRRKEMIREELHRVLKKAFSTSEIHSEYGMTELLSQAYSKGNGRFQSPNWMKIMTRDSEDPLSWAVHRKTGGVNVIDLANVYSCAFIATQDLGKTYEDGSFEVLGRFDHSDIRGCNLMAL